MKGRHVCIHHITTEKQLVNVGTKFFTQQPHRSSIELIKRFQE